MNDSQDKKYWRRWAACVRANHWRMVKGRLDPAAVLDASEHHCSVHAAALQFAQTEALGLNANHLRHGCHLVALGHDKPHGKFSNKEFDALLNYWGDERALAGLLICPEHLGSIIHQSSPELKARERMLIGIRKTFIEGHVANLSHAIYGTRDWEQLADRDLENLQHILHTKPKARKVGSSRCDDPARKAGGSEATALPSRSAQRADPTSEDPDWSVA